VKPDPEDAFATARGFVNGLGISVAFWAGVVVGWGLERLLPH
jgi:hypothetical protein